MRKAVRVAAHVVVIGFLVILLYKLLPEQQISVDCRFVAADSQAILPGIESGLSFKGAIEPPTKGEAFDLRSVEGTLSWSDGDKPIEAEAIGSIFTSNDGDILAVSMFPLEPAKGFRDFSVATLNDDGQLDEDRETAFVFRTQAERRLHPTSYKCDIGE